MDNGSSVLVTLTLTRADLNTLLETSWHGMVATKQWNRLEYITDYIEDIYDAPQTAFSITLPHELPPDERGELER